MAMRKLARMEVQKMEAPIEESAPKDKSNDGSKKDLCPV